MASHDTELTLRTAESEEDLAAALDIRARVFVEEQKIPRQLDDDGLDGDAIHVLAFDGGRAVATARLLATGSPTAVIARVAVLPEYRGRGLGRDVVLMAERLARSRGKDHVVLHPHAYLERFYADLGYCTIPGTDTAGPHQLITMEKQLELE